MDPATVSVPTTFVPPGARVPVTASVPLLTMPAPVTCAERAGKAQGDGLAVDDRGKRAEGVQDIRSGFAVLQRMLRT